MATLAAIRAGLATRLRTIPSVASRVYERVPDKLQEPCLVIGLPVLTYDEALRGGLHRVQIGVRVYVNERNAPSEQVSVDSYLDWNGPNSVKAAIEADPTLGGTVDLARVTTADKYGSYEVAGITYTGAELTVDIYTA